LNDLVPQPHLDVLPVALGVAGAAAGAVLVPIAVTAGLGAVGFGAAGPVAGMSGSFPP